MGLALFQNYAMGQGDGGDGVFKHESSVYEMLMTGGVLLTQTQSVFVHSWGE